MAHGTSRVRRRKNPETLTANVPTGIVQIVGEKRTFYLREPIDLETYRESGRYIIEFPPLNLSSSARTEQKAYSAFAEEFEAVWGWIAESPDRDLTQDARQLKARFRALVESVEDQAR